jgi:PqqD family protein of HPr-rel-A system
LTEGSGQFDSEWVACDIDALYWAEWPDGCTVYHRPSGATHLLNPSSVWLLRRLSSSPLSVRAAASELANQQGAPLSTELCAEVEHVLFRFGHLGLVRCVKKP